MTDPKAISFDREAVNHKYAQERSKRMIEGRAATRDLSADEHFSAYRDDPFTPYVERDPIDDEIDVAIIGAGLAGVVAGADLRGAGIERIRLIDGAGGIGGTWYWNRYPGVMCDVESYVYMPKLEEMGYVPTTRYAFGDEIRRHLDAIAERYDLIDSALFHTTVQQSEWDEDSARWILTTDRGDVIRAHYLVVAPGILNLMKLPAIAGMEKFRGRSFHSARWDYGYTGGAPDDPHLDKLGDKVVGIIGTGASAIQAVPAARGVGEAPVRVPAHAVGHRRARQPADAGRLRRRPRARLAAAAHGELLGGHDRCAGGARPHRRRLDPPHGEGLEPGDLGGHVHRRRRADGRGVRLLGDGGAPLPGERDRRTTSAWPRASSRTTATSASDPASTTSTSPRSTATTSPSSTARRASSGSPSGVWSSTAKEIALDCIIYATGFEAEITPFPRRATHPIIGRGGVTIAEKFADGPITLFGLMTSGFPNMFLMPAPGLQSVVTVNYTHLAVEGAEHIAETIAMLERRGIRVADVLPEAEADWTAEVVSTYRDSSGFMAACTPSRLNFEGDVSRANPRTGAYRGGYGDFFAYQKLLRDWRARGDFAGLQLEEGADAAR